MSEREVHGDRSIDLAWCKAVTSRDEIRRSEEMCAGLECQAEFGVPTSLCTVDKS